MQKPIFISLFYVLCFGLIACKPEPVDPPDPEPASGRVLIVNEGNFQWGNASLDLYNPERKSLQSGLFEIINERPLGDVFQSMAFLDGRAYLSINNSQKIEIIDAESLQSYGTIEGLTSPRYIMPLSDTELLVSDLYDDSLAIVDLNSQKIAYKIPAKGWTEKMVYRHHTEVIWILNVSQPHIHLLDTYSDQIFMDLEISPGANGIVEDKEGMIWVSCGGSLQDSVKGYLYKIHGDGRTVIKSFEFPEGNFPRELHLNPARDSLYFLNEGLQAMSIYDESLPTAVLVDEADGLFYGLGVDPSNGDIYISDAIDYVQRGLILRYRPNGQLVDEFRAGIIPSRFYFR